MQPIWKTKRLRRMVAMLSLLSLPVALVATAGSAAAAPMSRASAASRPRPPLRQRAWVSSRQPLPARRQLAVLDAPCSLAPSGRHPRGL